MSLAGPGRELLRHEFLLPPLLRVLAGLLVSVLPVVNLAGLGAIGHDLAAGAVVEGVSLLGPPPAVPAGLSVHLPFAPLHYWHPGGGVAGFDFSFWFFPFSGMPLSSSWDQ